MRTLLAVTIWIYAIGLLHAQERPTLSISEAARIADQALKELGLAEKHWISSITLWRYKGQREYRASIIPTIPYDETDPENYLQLAIRMDGTIEKVPFRDYRKEQLPSFLTPNNAMQENLQPERKLTR